MTDILFQMWFTATWQAIVLAGVVFIVLSLFRERLQPRWRYLLWCVVLLRLAMPVLPETPWGIWNENVSHVVPMPLPPMEVETVTEIPTPVVLPQPVEFAEVFEPTESPATVFAQEPVVPAAEEPKPIVFPSVYSVKMGFLVAWLAGFVFLLLKHLWNEYRFRRQSRRWKPAEIVRLLALFEQCRKETGIRQRVRLKTAPDDVGAGCFGFFRPVIVLSESATKMNENDLRMILLHELVHLKRLDPLVLRISMLLSLIHWPNPLVWFVLSRLQREREPACDAAVLHILGQNKQKDYGLAILAFAELFPCRQRLPGLVGIFEKNGTARRIEMIIKYKRSKWPHALLGLLIITLVAALGLTRAQTPSPSTTNAVAKNTESTAVVDVTPIQQNDERPPLEITDKPAEVKSKQEVRLGGKDPIVFENGRWTNEKTGKEVKPPLILADARLHIEQEGDEAVIYRMKLVEFMGPGQIIRQSDDDPSKTETIEYSGDLVMDGLLIRESNTRSVHNVDQKNRVISVSGQSARLNKDGVLLKARYVRITDGGKSIVAGDSKETAKKITVFKFAVVRTLDENRKPLPNVDIRVLLPDFKDDNRAKTTDENGNMAFTLPDSPKELIVSATAPGRVPQIVHWGRDDMTKMANVTFTLRKGTTIGGTVVDAENKPVAGASVRVISRPNGYGMPGHLKPADSHILAYGDKNPNTFGGVTARKTDANGRWTLDNVPEGKFYPVEIEITHPDFQMNDQLGSNSFSTQNAALAEKLRKGEYRFTMKRGVSVSGTVRDGNGKPVKDALIVPGGDPVYYSEDRQQAVRTDADGKYRLGSLRFGPGTLTVIAEGFAPDMKSADFGKDTKAIDFDLKPGKKLEIRIVDAWGKPVPGVQVVIGNNSDNWWRDGANIFNESRTPIPNRTDAEGIYRWDWAPEDAVRFRFMKDGFMSYHSAKPYWFTADEKPHTFVMNRLHVKGRVIHKEVGAPIHCTITPGWLPEQEGGEISWQTTQTVKNTTGDFTYVIPFDWKQWKIRIEAGGCRPYVSRTLDANEGEQGVVDLGIIALEKAEIVKGVDLSGQVFGPDGKPAAGAKILLAKERAYTEIVPPNLASEINDPRRRLIEADGQGKFHFETPTDGLDYRLYVADSNGFAQVDKAEFKDGMSIRLQAYGKLEVKIPYDSKLEAHNRFQLSQREDVILDENNRPVMPKMFGYIRYQANVPQDGLVVIDHIVPGKYSLQKMARNKRMTYNVTNFDMEIRSGETKRWDLTAPNGVKVVARIRLPDDYEGEFTAEDWDASQFRLSIATDKNGPTTMNWLERIRPSENDPREGVVEIEHVVPGSGHWDIGLNKYKKREDGLLFHPTQESLVGALLKPVTIPESTGEAFDLGTIKVTRFKPKP